MSASNKKIDEVPKEIAIEPKSDYIPLPARVTAKPMMNFRELPDGNSKILDSIPEGYVVYTIERTETKENIAGHEDYWYKTKFKNKTGWLFGKYLEFEEKDVSITKIVQPSAKTPSYPTNYKKLRKYFDANMIQKNYKQVIAEYGKPTSELKYKGSNPHGGFNSYLEVVYPDFRFKFIDQILYDVTFFTSEKLKSKTIQIGSERQELEMEFEVPYYISKDEFSYLTCLPHSEDCPTGYPNAVNFLLENHKVKEIRLTVYMD
ncbi:MAG TPA: SH3 domain-containing protein [Leptospiraceae bacterium]|nr:SH3 domain-containing protein [Leptospiraceae bacterium]HMW07361.1 SH3 domain-containing protein [Leptospiraceae bacterium]HMX34385.1 SH3 domain-containing protein [Leptospiraceae bacterium]HMY32931.1 SH3 domain-containing protein [Leptospiraceae bacterium]HNA08218.1 SH3 domain-containing protein [Leptospiraceae bacterium]